MSGANIFDFNSQTRVEQFDRKADDRAQRTRDELASRAREFVEWLFDGRALIARDGKTAMIGDVLGTPGESLNIVLRGAKAGAWHDFANQSDQGSDLIGLYMANMGYDRRRDFVKALDEIGSEFLGWAPINRPSRPDKPAKERIAEVSKVHGQKPKASVELGAPTASYHYYSIDGTILATVRRYDFLNAKGETDKTFRQWDGQGRPQAPNPRPLYRLPEIVQAQSVVLVEGEKCAEALASVGIEATTAIGGANTDLAKVDWTPLAGKQITIWPDADDAGRAYAGRVTPLLQALGCEVTIVQTEGHAAKWDAAKCLEEGGDVRAVLLGATESAPADGPIFAGDFNGEPPERRWVVPQWIPEGTVTALYGDGGLGKTLIAQQLLYSAGTGLSWLGMPVPALRGLGVFCEDDEPELHRRHNAILKAMGFDGDNPLTDTWVWPRVGHENLLVTFDRDNKPAVMPFLAEIERHVIGNRIQFLVLDTTADLFGGNENIRPQVNHFIKAVLGGLIVRCREAGWVLTILLLAHPSQAGLSSGRGDGGSTGWNNAVRSRIYLNRDDDAGGNARTLTRKKSNYAASGDETALSLMWQDGVITTREDNQQAHKLPEREIIREILKDIDAAWSSKLPWSHNPQAKRSGRYAPQKINSRYPSVTARAAEALILKLLENDVLTYEMHNSDSKQMGLRVRIWDI